MFPRLLNILVNKILSFCTVRDLAPLVMWGSRLNLDTSWEAYGVEEDDVIMCRVPVVRKLVCSDCGEKEELHGEAPGLAKGLCTGYCLNRYGHLMCGWCAGYYESESCINYPYNPWEDVPKEYRYPEVPESFYLGE